VKGISRLMAWIILVPLTVVMIAFAIANRHDVAIRLDPVPIAIDMPLFAAIFLGIFLGLMTGGFAAWLRARKWRRAAARERRRADELARELAARDQAGASDDDKALAKVA
jgi:uncharacterized integral membrane protein